MNREQISELYGDDLLFLDPAEQFDKCIVGIVSRCGIDLCLAYSRDKVIAALMEDGMDEDEAEEFFDFNMAGAYVGDKTPFYLEELP